jgi:hypothetical protein
MKLIINFILILLWSLPMKADAFFEYYCIGYFEEVYWVLDPIEEEDVRGEIINFFNDQFSQSESLNFDLYYDSSTRQFIFDDQNTDHDQFIKVNYPNFEIILLDTYINLFTQGDNYCPAFWNDCSEESLDSFFSGAEEFSDTWEDEESVLSFLKNDFINNQCISLLNTKIDRTQFIADLNILIKELTNN